MNDKPRRENKQKKPPDICALRNQSLAGTLPPTCAIVPFLPANQDYENSLTTTPAVAPTTVARRGALHSSSLMALSSAKGPRPFSCGERRVLWTQRPMGDRKKGGVDQFDGWEPIDSRPAGIQSFLLNSAPSPLPLVDVTLSRLCSHKLVYRIVLSLLRHVVGRRMASLFGSSNGRAGTWETRQSRFGRVCACWLAGGFSRARREEERSPGGDRGVPPGMHRASSCICRFACTNRIQCPLCLAFYAFCALFHLAANRATP